MGKLWTVKDVADFLGIPVKTLYEWRYQGYGPKGIRVGRYLRYRPEDLKSWIESLEKQECVN